MSFICWEWSLYLHQVFFFQKNNHTLRFLKTKEHLLSFHLLIYVLIYFEYFQIGTASIHMLQIDDRRNWVGKRRSCTVQRSFKDWQDRYIYDRIPNFTAKSTPKEPYICNTLKILYHLSLIHVLMSGHFSLHFYLWIQQQTQKSFT